VCGNLIYRLNIQEKKDYYTAKKVRRIDPSHKMKLFKVLRYVNVFLHESIKPKSKGKVKSAISGKLIPVPRSNAPPMPVQPPLKENHAGYSNGEIDKYFERLLKANTGQAWNLKKAVYTNPNPERVEEKLPMKCMAEKYGGELVEVDNLENLIDHLQRLAANSPNKNPQIVGFLGHGLTKKLRLRHRLEIEVGGTGKKKKTVTITKIVNVTTLQGRIIIGKQQILEDLSTDAQIISEIKDKIKKAFLKDKKIKKLIEKSKMSEEDLDVTDDQVKIGITNATALQADQSFLTSPETQNHLEILSTSVSPLAVIVAYHCHNGRRRRFLQNFANSVRRPVFAYTGFLGWYYTFVGSNITIKKIKDNWAQVKDRLASQEFNYQIEKFSKTDGDWVLATPTTASVNPVKLSVRTGQAATFAVAVLEDNKPSKYQWYEDNNPIAGQTAAQLRITKDKAGTYTYYCKVTDAIEANADSNEVTLTVTNPPL
jgi:hypothetical protein